MRAVVFEEFGVLPEVRRVPDPEPSPDGVVIRVEATGLCRSDWHGWLGHDPDITLPHVPGHELSGVVEAVGTGVRDWRSGDAVTVPFVCACGRCRDCAAGNGQVCANQTQPGFTGWGSFAEFVAIDNADVNLVAVPEGMTFATAASLGCRFATAFRAVVHQGAVRGGEWVAVHGCGGVGLSAVMIAAACGARVVAVDISAAALELARQFGATACVDAAEGTAERVMDITDGGAHLSLDALGSATTCAASINGLRRGGRHVQVGLLPKDPPLPMARVIGWELRLLGSHGMAAAAYPPMMDMVADGRLRPDRLITGTIGLDEAPRALAEMAGPGITIIEPG
ncbi:zinc-dependent alcohol dehydrogenase family protein [Stackebrandtia nassauensis]|uniref:Alcohol dehydrogenase zinc-binding domain protein n=1 Tax=Stackebrandtia nassauensis (strain DSM 44728 / CIP 108903 / NRRL B-16338 / NBRC 102104 / LLR-40K-21) TaxID=446470 RepID=D3Q1T1_STANL|nr:zinc-dependent alcohol dehydrogenase family protein [Stackebrandtia nassauensis]ADD39929.1 Alcohol dehydrogenase zinc-binding domain protein [Stackebrandtia nassauensis DSM 44728]